MPTESESSCFQAWLWGPTERLSVLLELFFISVVEQDPPIPCLFSALTIRDSRYEVWHHLLAKKQQEPEIMATLV